MATEEKKQILLVDDEKHLLISLRDYLISEGFDIILAKSGEEALKILEKKNPNLIVLDISMPGMGGVGFLKRITGEDGKPTYPVLVLTARSTMEDFFSTLEVDGFLGKPCEKHELVSKINEILDMHKTTEEKKTRIQKQVLIAEDDFKTSNAIKTAFEAAGYILEVVNNGPEVLEKAAVFKPDVIIMKELLPRLNGSAAASLIEVMPSINNVPVIIYDDTRTGGDSIPRAKELKCIKAVLNTSNPADLLKTAKQFA